MGGSGHGIDDEFMATMLGDFLDESQGYLTNLNNNLLALDQLVSGLAGGDTPSVDPDLLNEMFRDAHSLKGLSAMLQLSDINSLTHKIENVFDAARDGRLRLDGETVELMFQAFDRLTAMVENLRDQTDEEIEFESVAEQMRQLLESRGAVPEPFDFADTSPEHPPIGGAPEEATIPGDNRDTSARNPSPTPGTIAGSIEGGSSVAGSSEGEAAEDPLSGVEDEQAIPDKYLAIFIDETLDSLDTIGETLLGEDSAPIDPLLVRCHQIKGGAAAIGLNRIAKLAHLMEDRLQECRERNEGLSVRLADALTDAADALRNRVEQLRTGVPGPDDFANAYRGLRPTRDQATDIDAQVGPAAAEMSRPGSARETAPQPPPDTTGLTSDERAQIRDLTPPGQGGWAGYFVIEPGLPLAEVKAQLAISRLEQCGDLFFHSPDEAELARAVATDRVVFGLATTADDAQIRGQLRLDGIVAVHLEPLQITPDVARAKPAEPDSAELAEPESTAFDEPRAAEPAANGPGFPGPSSPPPRPDAAVTETRASERDRPEAPRPIRAATDLSAEAIPATPPQRPGETTAHPKGRPTETLRVDIDRLDHLMNLTGQLVINKARFGQIADQFRGVASRKQGGQCVTNMRNGLGRLLTELRDVQSGASPGTFAEVESQVDQMMRDLDVLRDDVQQWAETRSLVTELSDAAHQLERISDGIQKSVMDTRMLPIGPLFSRFKRVIRDITRGNGKDVRLTIRGEKTELDKRMIDELGDPLIHMVRNAADHGIESPEVRRLAGKPTQGTITLDAFHRGNRIFVQVRDDGRGLDADKLRAKAIAKGILSPQDAERLTPQQAYQLIWEPGFSTAEAVTEVSGRGMGMDIVRSKIEQLNGIIQLDSEPGVGTTITIKLPLTMAILPSLLTVICDDVFAIPVESVSEIVRVRSQELKTVHGLSTARVRGRIVSVVELPQLFRWKRPVPPARGTADRTLVIVGSDGNELGLVVDSLLGEEDIVIKSLAENYRNVNGLAGASILGDGRVSLILDVSTLLAMACHGGRSVEPRPPDGPSHTPVTKLEPESGEPTGV